MDLLYPQLLLSIALILGFQLLIFFSYKKIRKYLIIKRVKKLIHDKYLISEINRFIISNLSLDRDCLGNLGDLSPLFLDFINSSNLKSFDGISNFIYTRYLVCLIQASGYYIQIENSLSSNEKELLIFSNYNYSPISENKELALNNIKECKSLF